MEQKHKEFNRTAEDLSFELRTVSAHPVREIGRSASVDLSATEASALRAETLHRVSTESSYSGRAVSPAAITALLEGAGKKRRSTSMAHYGGQEQLVAQYMEELVRMEGLIRRVQGLS